MLVKITLAFETVVFDRLHLPGGQVIPAGKSFEMFLPSDGGIENDVTEIDEESLLKFFMSSPGSQLLFKRLDLPPNSRIAFSVREPIQRNINHPDFDLVICNPRSPHLTTAIQCKRVKVTAINDDKDKVNKLEGVGQVVKQARIQREEYGFHQNYIALFIQTFGRNREKKNVLFRGPSNETFQEIYDFPQRDSIHEDVGIIFIKITQPTGTDFREKGSIGICVDKAAGKLTQSTSLTERIAELMRSET